MPPSLTLPRISRAIRPGAVLAVVLVSYFMIVLDNSIVFTGLTRMRADLDFTTSGLSWVQNAWQFEDGVGESRLVRRFVGMLASPIWLSACRDCRRSMVDCG